MVTRRSAVFSGIALGSVLALSVPASAEPVAGTPLRGGVVAHTAAQPQAASVGFARRVLQSLVHGGREGARRGAKRLGVAVTAGGAVVGPIALYALLVLSADGSNPADRVVAPVGTAMLGLHAAYGGGFVGR